MRCKGFVFILPKSIIKFAQYEKEWQIHRRLLGINMKKVMTVIHTAKATDLYSSLQSINLCSEGEYYSDISKKGIREHLHSLGEELLQEIT